MIDDGVPNDHPIDHLGVKIWQSEPVLAVMLDERLFAGQHRHHGGWPEHLNIIRVLGDETLKVVRVVGIHLSLHRIYGVHR